MMENHPTESQQSPYRPNYLWVAIIFGFLLVTLTYGMSSVLVIPAIFVVVGSLVFTSLQPGKKMMGCIVLVVIGALIVVAMPNGAPLKTKAKNAEVKANLHWIQISLEKYATDNGRYPTSIQFLLAAKGDYLPEMPRNPFKGYQSIKSEAPWILDGNWMVPLNETGWPGNWDEHAGDFFYFPIKQQVNGELVTTGYDLLALGGITPNMRSDSWFHVKGAVFIIHLAGSLPADGRETP